MHFEMLQIAQLINEIVLVPVPVMHSTLFPEQMASEKAGVQLYHCHRSIARNGSTDGD